MGRSALRSSHDQVEFDLEINGSTLLIRASGKVLAPEPHHPAPHLIELMVDVYRRTKIDDVEASRSEFTDIEWAVIEEEASDRLYGDFNDRDKAAREERRMYA